MKIALIGQGGHSKVVQELIALNRQAEIVAYLDDQYEKLSIRDTALCGPISSAEMMINLYNDLTFVIAIGHNDTRRSIANQLDLPTERYATLVHPTANVSSSARISPGSVIMAHSVINAGAQIGNHAIINTSSVIEHGNQLGHFVHISPNATLTGGVKIGDGVHVGAGATVIPNLEIGEWSVIGAGAAVIRSIPAYSTAVGVPAKVKSTTAEGC